MKSLAIVGGFGTGNLAWIDQPDPRPGPGECLVRIEAAALNYRDLQIVEGRRSLPLPLVPLSDAAGVVVAMGEGVSRFSVGDRVMPAFAPGWISGPAPLDDVLPTLGGPLPGVARPFAAWPESWLVRTPGHLTDVEAATLPCAGVSAWNALFVASAVRPGSTVLVQGTGGVALFALQFAKLAGARVILISSSDDKIARAKALGADEAINYRSVPGWGAVAHALAGRGVDLVVEVGGEKTMAESVRAVRNGGHISYVGFLSGARPDFDLGELSRKSIRLTGIRVGNRDSFEAMCAAIAASGLHPAVDSVFDLAYLAGAFARLAAGAHFGKIAVRIGEP